MKMTFEQWHSTDPILDGIDRTIYVELMQHGYKDKEALFVLWWLDNDMIESSIYDENMNEVETLSKSDFLEKIGYKHDR